MASWPGKVRRNGNNECMWNTKRQGLRNETKFGSQKKSSANEASAAKETCDFLRFHFKPQEVLSGVQHEEAVDWALSAELDDMEYGWAYCPQCGEGIPSTWGVCNVCGAKMMTQN